MDQTELVAFTGTASGGSNSGWFNTIYSLSAGVSSQPGTGVYLLPGNPPPATYPMGCNSVSGNPTCNLGLALDSHLSCAGGCDHGSLHSCGTTYNYANLGPAFNAWQNMETCWPTSNPRTTPTATFGPVPQFTHTFATGTSKIFNNNFRSANGRRMATGCFGRAIGDAILAWCRARVRLPSGRAAPTTSS